MNNNELFFLILFGIIGLLILLVLFYKMMFNLVFKSFKRSNEFGIKLCKENKLLIDKVPINKIVVRNSPSKVYQTKIQTTKILNDEHRERICKQLYYNIAEDLWNNREIDIQIYGDKSKIPQEFTIQGKLNIIDNERDN